MKLGALQEESRTEDPNITPLIDIVFILLIFFVVTTTFAKDLGLEVDRPEAATGNTLPSRVVRVALGARGDLTVDAQPVSPWRIEAAVKERFELNASRVVLVVADRSVDADRLVSAIDAARRAGASQVSLAVEEAQ
ncbi:MAG: biopolymer transporter ExbD [Myxococcota bacterium]